MKGPLESDSFLTLAAIQRVTEMAPEENLGILELLRLGAL